MQLLIVLAFVVLVGVLAVALSYGGRVFRETPEERRVRLLREPLSDEWNPKVRGRSEAR